MKNHPDAMLTPAGIEQAESWAKDPLSFEVDMAKTAATHFREKVPSYEGILVSPCQRTIQTTCYAVPNSSTPMQLCWPLSEGWAWNAWNQPITVDNPEELSQLLDTLPNGSRIDVTTGIKMVDAIGQMREKDKFPTKMEQLRQILARRPEKSILMVTHGGVIDDLLDPPQHAENCQLLERVIFTNRDSTEEAQLRCVTKCKAPWFFKGK